MEKFKKCSRCGGNKTLDSFSINTGHKGGRHSLCKACVSTYEREYSRTPKGLLAKIYNNQVTNSRRRGHSKPKYSLLEFREKYIRDKDYVKLHKSWAESGYTRRLRPSFDRKNDSVGYSFSNLNKWMTWGENDDKGHLDTRRGKLINAGNPIKPVIQFKDGVKIGEFISVIEASRQTNMNNSSIGKVCRGELNHTGGFQWKFKETVKTK